jgi:membrane protein implicated in regulation of membrane protease activity
MKTILLFIAFLAVIWVPVLLKLYSWKEGLILTVSLSIASYLIDRLILEKRKKHSGD